MTVGWAPPPPPCTTVRSHKPCSFPVLLTHGPQGTHYPPAFALNIAAASPCEALGVTAVFSSHIHRGSQGTHYPPSLALNILPVARATPRSLLGSSAKRLPFWLKSWPTPVIPLRVQRTVILDPILFPLLN